MDPIQKDGTLLLRLWMLVSDLIYLNSKKSYVENALKKISEIAQKNPIWAKLWPLDIQGAKISKTKGVISHYTLQARCVENLKVLQ